MFSPIVTIAKFATSAAFALFMIVGTPTPTPPHAATFTITPDGYYRIDGTHYAGCLPTLDLYFASYCSMEGYSSDNVQIFDDGTVIAHHGSDYKYIWYLPTLDLSETVTAYTAAATSGAPCIVADSTGTVSTVVSGLDAFCVYAVIPGNAYTVTVEYGTTATFNFVAEDHAQEYPSGTTATVNFVAEDHAQEQ